MASSSKRFSFVVFMGLVAPILANEHENITNDNEIVASEAGVYVKVLRQSGKILISRAKDIESDENKILIEMDEIKEKSENGVDVGQDGSPGQNHTFNTFRSQQFDFSDVRNGRFENISAKTFNFTANIANGAMLIVDVYIFNENGIYNLSGEVTSISEGSVKFNIRIKNWKFCGYAGVSCTKGQTAEIGKYIDFTIGIKGISTIPQKIIRGKTRTTAEEYDLGSGSVVTSSRVQYDDGDWVDTPSGYPKLVTQGSNQLFVFRFDKFEDTVLYDPQVDIYPQDNTTTTTTVQSPNDKTTNRTALSPEGITSMTTELDPNDSTTTPEELPFIYSSTAITEFLLKDSTTITTELPLKDSTTMTTELPLNDITTMTTEQSPKQTTMTTDLLQNDMTTTRSELSPEEKTTTETEISQKDSTTSISVLTLKDGTITTTELPLNKYTTMTTSSKTTTELPLEDRTTMTTELPSEDSTTTTTVLAQKKSTTTTTELALTNNTTKGTKTTTVETNIETNGSNETVVGDAGVHVKVLGHSGKIMMSRSEEIESDENRVIVEMDAIKEKSENGLDVGLGGPPSQKHSFNTFASQQFYFSDVMDGMFENISAKTFNFTATIANGAMLIVDVYIFNEKGTYNLSGEVTSITEGSIKFNIRIKGWKFCGDTGVSCKSKQITEIGKYLDFTIAIKGKGTTPQKKIGGTKRTTADEYDLGSGSVVISDKVQYNDGDWVNTPSGYPMLVTQGSKQLFVFRFDKFKNSVLYDPQIDLAPNNSTISTTEQNTEGNTTTTTELDRKDSTTTAKDTTTTALDLEQKDSTTTTNVAHNENTAMTTETNSKDGTIMTTPLTSDDGMTTTELTPFETEANVQTGNNETISNGNNTVVHNEGVYVKVLGHSGKIMMSRSKEIESDENRVVVEMDEIKEKSESGSDVGQGGPPSQKHSFNTFANQQFNFSDIVDGMFENISAKTFNFTASIANGAMLIVEVYIFNEKGTYNLSGEVTKVLEGSVKFNIRVKDWKFCGDTGVSCKSKQITEIGKYLDFTITIKGKGATPQKKIGGTKRTTAEEYDLGSGSVVISDKVKYDNGDWVNTPSGYPKLVTQGSKQLFVFRFDKFADNVLYDPQVDLAPENSTITTTDTTLNDANTMTTDSTPGTTELHPTTAFSPAETDANVGNIYVKVLGQSGKIQVGKGPNLSSDPNRITIEFSTLQEKKSDDSNIVDNKHSFNTSFATTKFTFTPLIDDVFMNKTDVKTFSFNAPLNADGAVLETEVYIFKEDANITLDGETTLVKAGNMKFSTKITGWKFCGHGGVKCTPTATGEYLDFAITIKGKGTASKKASSRNGNSDEYDLGGGSYLLMSKKVKYDGGDWADMASGYPKLTTYGNKQTFYIRFNRFKRSAYYDPTVSYSLDDETGNEGGGIDIVGNSGSHVVLSIINLLFSFFVFTVLV